MPAPLGQKNGEIEVAQTEAIVPISNLRIPATLVINSTAVGAEIALSADGSEWFVPALDHSSGTQKLVSLATPMAFVKFTGVAGDEYFIL